MTTIEKWKSDLRKVARPEKVKILSSFFKTGKGEYAEGDIFIGIIVPDNRAVAITYADADICCFQEMLNSEIHEFRLSALLAMIRSYNKTKLTERRSEIIELYLNSTARCNNWDLVDQSAPYLLGPELAAGRCLDRLEQLSESQLLWNRRIAVVATLHLVKRGDITLATEQCLKHLSDTHPLMHKAVGWILREIGKKDQWLMLEILHKHIGQISAITLSYATEKLPQETRQALRALRKKVG
jgi:3-methyladenine DNA glycosylase AlkD